MFIAEAGALGFAEQFCADLFEWLPGQLMPECYDALHLPQKPGINPGQLMDLADRHAALQRRKQPVNAVGFRLTEFFPQQPLADFRRRVPRRMGLQGTDSLLQCLLERSADGHHFADRLHLRTKQRIRTREFLELPFRNLHDHVVDRRLEARRGFPGDVVRNFVQRQADGQFGSDLGDGKTGGLAGQCRAARNAGIHFDHHHAPGLRLHSELDVRASRLHAHLADDGRGCVAHALIFLVGQCLGRCDGDRIASVDAHRVQVFDRAHHHEVVPVVAHDLQLVLFPT